MNIQEQIDAHYERIAEPPRPHMGCSLLGHPCDRYLWLHFRWAIDNKFPGRLLRLFARGHAEEEIAVKNLRAIGMNIFNRQKTVEFGQHVSGSIDGMVERVPDTPFEPHLFECKTFNKKSFNELEKKGVRDAKPVHYTQMQVYMLGTNLKKALYYAVCKDNDSLYTEVVDYNEFHAKEAVERGQRLAMSERMPEPCSATGEYYICRMCPAKAFCFETHCTTEANCRTCAYSVPTEDSQWQCKRHDDHEIPYNWQLQGCESHVLHFDLSPYSPTWAEDGCSSVLKIDGHLVRNGEPADGCYSSKEVLADTRLCAARDPLVEALRKDFDGRIVKKS